MRILVADDSAVIRRFIIEALKGMPFRFRLTEVDNGKDCMDKLATDEFDFAFVDINMPRMTGLEILKAARAKKLHTYIVIISTETADNFIKSARDLRAYDYLAKPFTVADVHAVLENYRQLVQSANVLIVDDSSTVRRVVRKVLDQSFFNLRTEEVGDGGGALQKVRNRNYDLIFLDLNMPGLSGVETLSFLRTINTDVKVVMITATKAAELGPEVRDAGFNGILHKPFFPEDIDAILHQLFNMHARHIAQDETFVIDLAAPAVEDAAGSDDLGA